MTCRTSIASNARAVGASGNLVPRLCDHQTNPKMSQPDKSKTSAPKILMRMCRALRCRALGVWNRLRPEARDRGRVLYELACERLSDYVYRGKLIFRYLRRSRSTERPFRSILTGVLRLLRASMNELLGWSSPATSRPKKWVPFTPEFESFSPELSSRFSELPERMSALPSREDMPPVPKL